MAISKHIFLSHEPLIGSAASATGIENRIEDTRTLSMGWFLPVVMAVYLGFGGWIGSLLGARLAGVLVGWALGMGAVFYEIWKERRRQEQRDRKQFENKGVSS